MDLLSDVLTVSVHGSVAATVDAGEPWGLSLDQVPGAAFHAVTMGTAWLRAGGEADRHLMPGDVVLLPNGAPHALVSEPHGQLVPFDHAAAQRATSSGGRLHVGSDTVVTRILCASYRQDPAVTTPVLRLLPDVVHIAAGASGPGLSDTLRLLAGELQNPQIASAALLDRLVDVLLIQVLRVWIAGSPDLHQPSWLAALADPTLAAALNALHAQPSRPWTIDSLARHVSVSRATLARRFATHVGEGPLAYLTRWRMDLAARRLRDTDDPISAIGASVGYTSEYAFSRAFSRDRGTPPGRYRTSSRSHATQGSDAEIIGGHQRSPRRRAPTSE